LSLKVWDIRSPSRFDWLSPNVAGHISAVDWQSKSILDGAGGLPSDNKTSRRATASLQYVLEGSIYCLAAQSISLGDHINMRLEQNASIPAQKNQLPRERPLINGEDCSP
jgi:hypothetical protein